MKKRIYAVINYIEGAIGMLALLYYFLCVGLGISAKGILFVWLIGGGALVLKSILVCVAFYKGAMTKKKRIGAVAFSAIFWVWAMSVALFCVPLISNMHQTPPDDLDYILVLGARVMENGEPSKALQSRIDTASAYLKDNPETMAIATGGRGKGEPVSESVCIKKELIAQGIDEERNITEEHSGTTVENFRFSKPLLPNDATVGVVTNDFHVYRSKLTAKKQLGKDVEGISAPFSGILLPHYMLREFITFLVDTARGNL